MAHNLTPTDQAHSLGTNQTQSSDFIGYGKFFAQPDDRVKQPGWEAEPRGAHARYINETARVFRFRWEPGNNTCYHLQYTTRLFMESDQDPCALQGSFTDDYEIKATLTWFEDGGSSGTTIEITDPHINGAWFKEKMGIASNSDADALLLFLHECGFSVSLCSVLREERLRNGDEHIWLTQIVRASGGA